MNELRVENITKSFKISKKQQKNSKSNVDRIVALQDFSASFKEGEIYGLLGPNGAGKTTSLRIIASLIKADSGEIYFNDKNIYDEIYFYRKKVGFLTSELKLDDFFTPDYTFTYMSRLYGLSEEETKANKEKLFNRFGISAFKDVKIHDLSTGMKQKVSLAISLCNNPDVIIFDEPTNGLDIVASKDVEDFLLDLKKENKIIIISTHIFSIIEKLCDRVAIILKGKKVLEGELKEVTKDKSLDNVFFNLYYKEQGHEEY